MAGLRTVVLRALASRLERLAAFVARQAVEDNARPQPEQPTVPLADPAPAAQPGGPPAHWLELVQAKAPGLLAEMAHHITPLDTPQANASPQPGRAAEAPRSAQPPDYTPANAAAPTPALRIERAETPPSPPIHSPPGAPPAKPVGLVFSGAPRRPGRAPSYNPPQEPEQQPIRLLTPPRTGHARRGRSAAAAAPARGPQHRQVAGDATPTGGGTNTAAAPASERSAPRYPEQAASAPGRPGWAEHAAAPPAPEPGFDAASRATAQTQRIPAAEPPAVRGEPARSFEAESRPASRPANPNPAASAPVENRWPPLLDETHDNAHQSDDGVGHEREQARRRRLDTEQRGMGWNEPLS